MRNKAKGKHDLSYYFFFSVQAISFTLEEAFIYPLRKTSFPWKSTKYVPDREKN